MFEIIDFHTHPFLEARGNICAHAACTGNSLSWFMQTLDKAGITRFCGSVLNGRTSDLESMLAENRDALRIRDSAKGRYVPGFHVSPLYVDQSISEIRYAAGQGVRLIGELVPYMKGWEDYSCPELSPVLDAAEEYGMLISLHTNQLDQMEKAAKAHKGLKFVFAHPGEKDTLLKHIEIMKSLSNVYLDLSGTGVFRYGMLRRLVDEVGADRILFGSDFPICNPFCYVASVLGEELNDEERAQIFSGNARRLLGL